MCLACDDTALIYLEPGTYPAISPSGSAYTICHCFRNGCYQPRGLIGGCAGRSRLGMVWRWARDHRGVLSGQQLRAEQVRRSMRRLANKHRRSLEILKEYGD
jgi:hypothetical protein